MEKTLRIIYIMKNALSLQNNLQDTNTNKCMEGKEINPNKRHEEETKDNVMSG